MDPKLIQLTYNPNKGKEWFNDDSDKPYNSSAWAINNKETTPERTTYYYTKALPGGAQTPPVVNKLKVNGKIVEDVTISDPDENGVITYIST